MFSEVLKIKPQLDNSDLNKMEKSLTSRFGKIAKSFGRGLKVASTLALGAAVLNSLLNPLQEVKAAIDRTLGKADDIVTNAKQFGTSTQNLLKLRSLGEINGLQPEQLDLLLTKFQGAVAQARKDPTDASVSAVRNFSGNADTAEGFFEFIQALQKLSKDDQVLAQQQIFGEKQVLKMAEFLQSDFSKTAKDLRNVDFGKVATATEKLSDLQELDAKNRTVRNLRDIVDKSNVIGSGTVNNLNKSEIGLLKRENGQISRSATAFTVEENMNQIKDNLQQLTEQLLTTVPMVMDTLNGITSLLKKAVEGWAMIGELLKKSGLMRGIKGLFGGKDE